MDNFTAKQIKLFSRHQDKIPCSCGRPVWHVQYFIGNDTYYKVHCTNCQQNLSVQAMYNAIPTPVNQLDNDTKITVNTGEDTYDNVSLRPVIPTIYAALDRATEAIEEIHRLIPSLADRRNK